MPTANPLPAPRGWRETQSFVDPDTRVRLHLAARFASVDDALRDPGQR